MVAAIAFESVVKLLAFLAVGAFVTWGLFDGPGDIFTRAAAPPRAAAAARPRPGPGSDSPASQWFALTLLSMLSVVLPAAPVPDDGRRERRRAARAARGLGVPAVPAADQPVRAADRPRRPAALRAAARRTPRPSCCRCRWPLGQPGLALFAFIGGLSAATGMIIVEAIAVSTMVCNDLVMPLLLRTRGFGARAGGDLAGCCWASGAVAIVACCCSATCTSAIAGEAYALVSIGLISFAAVAQFAPALLGGMYWKGGTRDGALAGLLPGFALWAYTLMLPSVAKSGWLRGRLRDRRARWASRLLQARAAARPDRPRQPDPCAVLEPAGQRRGLRRRVALAAAVGARGEPGARCSSTSSTRPPAAAPPARCSGAGAPRFGDLLRADRQAARRGAGASACSPTSRGSAASTSVDAMPADAQLVQFVETQLAGAIGSASARVDGRLGRRGGGARPRRRDAHPRRGVAAARLLARARGQVAFAAARHRRAARRQRAAQEPRPPEGRLHVLGDARAAHAADLDPRASPR